jgi:hypothetical protein
MAGQFASAREEIHPTEKGSKKRGREEKGEKTIKWASHVSKLFLA